MTLGRRQGPRGGDRKPLQIDGLAGGGGGGSLSTRITSQPCLDQLDPTVGNKGLRASHYPSPARRHEQHCPGHPPRGQRASPPSLQAIVYDLGPITMASSSKANQLEARDGAAWVSFSLQTVAWLWAAGEVTYVLQPGTCQGRGVASTGCIQGSSVTPHTSPFGHTWTSWGGQVGKTTGRPPPLWAQAGPWLLHLLPSDSLDLDHRQLLLDPSAQLRRAPGIPSPRRHLSPRCSA